jgi:hypothetical protein
VSVVPVTVNLAPTLPTARGGCERDAAAVACDQDSHFDASGEESRLVDVRRANLEGVNPVAIENQLDWASEIAKHRYARVTAKQ